MKVLFSIGFFAIIFCLGQSAPAEKDYATLYREVSKKCLEQTKAQPGELSSLMKDDVIPTSKEGKDMLGCIMTTLGYIKDGKFDIEAMIADNKKRAEDLQKSSDRITRKCTQEIKTEGLDDGEIAVALAKCYFEQKKKPAEKDFATLHDEVAKKCLEESKAEPNLLQSMIDDDAVPDTKEAKDFMGCMMTSFGYIKDGKLDTETMIADTKKQWKSEEHLKIAEKVVRKCTEEVKTEGKDVAEIAVAISKCYLENKIKHNLPLPDFLKKSAEKDYATLHNEITAKCMEDAKSGPNVIKSMIDDEVIPSNKQGKEVLGCIMTTFGYIKDGKFDTETMIADNKKQWKSEEHQKIADKIALKCTEEVKTEGIDVGDVAFAMSSCFLEKKNKHNLPLPDFLRKD